MCCDAPSPPDLAPTAAASERAAQLGYQSSADDLAFRKQVYAEQAPRQQELQSLASQVAKQQMGIADTNEQRAQQQWMQYQNAFMGNEQQTAADAYGASYLGDEDRAGLYSALRNGGSAEQLGEYSRKAEGAAGDAAMQRAVGQVNQSYGMQSRQLARYGAGDPRRAAAISDKVGRTQAIAGTGAANTARESARGQLMGLRTGVANFGRNMPNTAGQAFGLATQAGSSAVANQNAGFTSGLPYAQFQTGAYGTGLGAAGIGSQTALGYGGLQNQQYATQAGAAGAALGGLGQLAGMGAYGYFTGGK